MNTKKQHKDFTLINGDCIKEIRNLKNNSIDFSVFSPPFAELYVYSDKPEDLGNCKNHEEFFEHFNFLIPELNRVLKSGRLIAVHCADLPIQKGKEGFVGLRDFSGMLINAFINNGFIYHDRITIWKDPVVEMQRTKALGLLYKQLCKDSSMSRTGNADYILLFRKQGINEIPIKQNIGVDLWQRWASPIWMDINQTNVLNYTGAKEQKDEKHICPLQLDVIERCISLWSNENETVLSPFAGIGSEGYMALKLNRKFIGIELKESYYNQAIRNLESIIEQKKQGNLFK